MGNCSLSVQVRGASVKSCPLEVLLACSGCTSNSHLLDLCFASSMLIPRAPKNSLVFVGVGEGETLIGQGSQGKSWRRRH